MSSDKKRYIPIVLFSIFLVFALKQGKNPKNPKYKTKQWVFLGNQDSIFYIDLYFKK